MREPLFHPSVPSKVLIAGGAGFLGSHLCDAILAQNHDVLCVDNLSSGSIENVRHLLSHPRFRFLRHDIATPLDIEVDCIMNFACPASPVAYQADPIQTTKTSVFGTYNLLELARKRSIGFFQASTSEIYGDPLEHPQTEAYWGNVNSTGIRACYDEGKRCAESLCFDYGRQYGVDVRVIRIFNTYGPRMAVDDGRVVTNFIAQALNGKTITIYGDGSQTRSLCYVDDLIAGILKMANADREITGPVNLGNPHEISIAELAEIVIDVCGSKSRIVHLPLPKDDPKRRCPDISKARALLAWEPAVTLLSGLQKTVAFMERVFEKAA